MKPNDREDALARALDLLPPGDPAAADPRFLRNPELLAEARAARETAADVWLAVSPLQAAPPEVLAGVLEEIGRPDPRPEPARGPWWRHLPLASGWAAAAVIAIAWWPRGAEPAHQDAPPTASGTEIAPERPGRPAQITDPHHPRAASAEERRLRGELARLRDELARGERGEGFRPRVLGLRPPHAPPRDPAEEHARLMAILGEALRVALETESGAPGDPASLVIERGWPAAGWPVEDGGIIRHRHFPEDDWGTLGLLRSDEGSYFDPALGMLWEPDPEGRGFLGRRAEAELDLARFEPAAGGADRPQRQVADVEAEGYVIEDPASGTLHVIIEGAPPPAEGAGHWLVWNDRTGAAHETSLGNWVGGNSVSSGIHSIPLSADPSSVRLIERQLLGNASFGESVILGGP